MSIITGHFTAVLPFPPAWTASHSYAGGSSVQPLASPNGFFYTNNGGTGTSGGTEPTWPTVAGATVVDGGVTWTCRGLILTAALTAWDQEQSQIINGDLGGAWSPSTALTFTTANSGWVTVQGLTQITNGGTLLVSSGANVTLDTGDYPRNGVTHTGRRRLLVTPCDEAISVGDGGLGLRPDFALNSVDAVACAFTFLTASADDSSVTAATQTVQWVLPLEVHNTATLQTLTLTYRAFLGTPKARVVAIATSGAVTPLTSAANGADANGYVTAPQPDSTLIVQSWVIPIDGGAAPANTVMSRDGYAYELQVLEDATQTAYPGTLPFLSPVYCATTGPIDLANAPLTIDGFNPSVGARILVKNQFHPDENGVYLYPGSGLPFATVTGTPVPFWQAGHAYTAGQVVQPLGAVAGQGLYFQCTTSGTSGATQPTWPIATGATVTDGGAVWAGQGTLLPYAFQPVVELRTYGLQQGSVVPVANGTVNGGLYWQYFGASISTPNLGSQPAVGWGTIPTGFVSATTNDVAQEGPGVFAAQGNAYHAAISQFVNIATQAFQ